MKTGFFKSVLGLGITLAAFLVTSCDQPVALGQKVDLTAPVLVIVQDGGSLAPGAYIQGADNNIRVSAKDDSGIESVTVTYTYRYVLTQEDVAAGGPYEGQAAGDIIDKTKTVNARDYGNDIYGLDINSTDPDDPMADGEVNVRITAKDGSGKEGVLSNQTYTVKNDPPAIELNIPKLALSGESRPNPIIPDTPLKVTTGGFISGSASDALAGVEVGYPKIQFWTDGSPGLDGQGILTDEPDPNDETAWIPVDSPKTWNSKGEKALEFRYYLEVRDGNGNRTSPARALLPGIYYLRVKVQDIRGNEQIWPPEEEVAAGAPGTPGLYYQNKVTLDVQAAGIPPVISITPPANQYQNKAFTFGASATHVLGVAEMTWAVADPADPATKEKRITVTREIKNGNETESSSHTFTPGASYTDINDPGKTITLTDGVWTFYAGALSVDDASGERSYDVYIDTALPAVGITALSPFVKDEILNDAAANQSRHQYTVNGIITVSADAPYDTMKNGTEPDGKRSRRYIVLKGAGDGSFPTELNGLTTAEQLYGYTDDGHAGLFDAGSTGNIEIEPETSNIVINTTSLYTDTAYWLYVFVIDKDAAGNAGFAYAKIRVDQDTDKPRVEFSDSKTADIDDLKYLTDAGDPGEYASSILDANARINISLTDDDQIAANGTILRVWDYASGSVAPLDKSYTLTTNPGSIVSYTITRQDLARAFTGSATAVAGDIPEGIYYFNIKTSDAKTGSQAGLDPALSPVYGPSLFAIDTDFPRIGIDEGIRGAYQSTSFSLGAYAQDNSGITEISITQPAGGPAVVVAPEYLTEAGNGRVNFTYPITGIDNGHLSFTITAKDKFNKITSETVEVKYDVIPPKVIIENPVDPLGAPVVSSWVQGNIAGFSGKGTDWNNDAETEAGSNLKYVYYWIDKTGEVNASGAQHDDPGAANYFPALPVNEDTPGEWTRAAPIDNQWQIFHTIRDEAMASTVGADGIKALYVIAIDNAGNWSDTEYNTIAGGKFGVDQGSPALPTPTAGTGANKVGSSLYANGPFSFSFPAKDDNQLAPPEENRVSIARAYNKGSPVSIPHTDPRVSFTETTANKNYTYTLNEGNLTDGVYDYTLTVKDAAGHESSATFTLTVDKTPPTVNITRYQSTITRSDLDPGSHEYVNDYIRINVTAADAGSGVGVDEGDLDNLNDDKPMAKWWFLDSTAFPDDTAVNWDTDGGTPFTATPLEAVIDTKTIGDGSDRIFYAIVKDNAGNANHIADTDGNRNKKVRVNQESDKPVINITQPLPNGFGDQNLTILAAFSDDDGFEDGALYYRFLSDEGLPWPADTEGWIGPLALQSSPSTGTSVPELNMSPLRMEDIFNAYKSGTQSWNNSGDRTAVLGAEDKPKKIQIRATDSPINKVPNSGGTKSADVVRIETRTFTLDYTAPVVDQNFQANAIGTFASGAKDLSASTWGDSFHISGTFKERNIQTINLTVGGLSAALYDQTTDPAALPSSPLATFPTIGGGIAGSNGEDWTWYYSLDTTPQNASETIWNTLSQGPHSAQLVITDQVGQTAQHTVSFYKDTAPPEISFSNLSEERVIPKKLLLEAEDHNYVTGTDGGAYGELTGEDVKGLSDFTPPADWEDAGQVHTAARAYYESARPLLANTIIRDTDPLRGVFADEYSAVGGGNQTDVVFTYRFDTDPITENYEDDPVYTLWREGTNELLGAAGSKSTSWRIDMPLANLPDNTWQTDKKYPLADGFHTVTVKVEDALGNKAIKKDIAFFLDRDAPAINLEGDFLTAFPQNVVIGLEGVGDADDVFVIKGTASDANLKAIDPGQANSGIKIALTGYTGISFTETTYTAGVWTWAAAVPKTAFAALGNGSHTITVTATDVAGRETRQNWTFTKDAAKPEISFLNLDAAAANTDTTPAYFPNASDKILGVATDAVSNISALKYTIEKKTGAAWAVVAVNGSIPEQKDVDLLGATNSASKNWSIALGPPSAQNEGGIDLADGEYRLKVTASDSAKGKAPGSLPNSVDNNNNDWIYFIVDRTPPDMEIGTPNSVTTYFNGPITFTGTAKDTVGGSGMDKVVLSIRNHPEIYEEIGIMAFTGSDGDEWTQIIDPSTLSSGTYTINIVALDKAGHQTLRSKDIIFDNSEPVIEIESPAVDQYGTRVIGKTIIRGTSSDTGGSVAKMYYQIGKQEIEIGTVPVTAMIPGGVYTIANPAGTSPAQWEAAGATGAADEIFIAKAAGEGTGTVLPWKDSKLNDSTSLPYIDGGYPTPVTFDRGLALFTIELEKSDLFVTTNNTDYNNGLIWGSARWEYTTTTSDELKSYDESAPADPARRTLAATLPIRLLAQDLAGNLGLMEYKVRVDTHMDRAHTDINNPDLAAVVGGEVRLSGAANDNNSINSVWVRVNGGDHGNATVDANWLSWTDWDDDTANWWDWGKTGSPDTKDDTKQEILKGSSWEDSWGWHPAVLTNNAAGVSNWYINLNPNGKLTPPAGVAERRVYIQVFTKDTKHLTDSATEQDSVNGYITQYILVFNETVPVVEKVEVDRQDGLGTVDDYTPQMQISKTVKITAEVKDGEGLQSLKIRKTGQSVGNEYLGLAGVDGITVAPKKIISTGDPLILDRRYLVTVAGDYTAWGDSDSGSLSANSYFTASADFPSYTGPDLYEADLENNFVYTLEMELDTASLYPDATGLYDIQITATDNSEDHLYTIYNINFQIDNYYPRGAYTGLPEVMGNYDIRGSATDVPSSGTVQGLKSVTVYFSRMENGQRVYYTSEGVKDNEIDKFTTIKAKTWDGTSLGALGDIPYPVLGTNGKAGFQDHPTGGGMVIDHDESRFGSGDNDSAADADGYSEYWYDEGVTKIWGAQYDSTILRDGRITLHFVIEDLAGNRTYQETEIFVKNKVPELLSLSLGTAVYDSGDGNGPVQYQEIPASLYSGSGFIARNDKLSVKATLRQNTGNNANYYRVTYVVRQPGTVNSVTEGRLYTIASSTPLSIFTAVGAPNNNQGTSFIATASSSLGGGAVYAYNDAAAYTGIKAGDALTGGTDYVVDFPGDTNWLALGAGTAHPAPGTVFTSNGLSIPVGTTGTAYPASELRVKTGVFPDNALSNEDIDVVFGATSFGAIPDSGTGTDNDRFFLIKVYDLTDTMDSLTYSAGAVEADQLFDIILAGLRIENADKNRPVTQLYDFNPKAETSRVTGTRLVSTVGNTTTITNPLQGGLFMENGKISGHIEPRSPGLLTSNGVRPAPDNTSAWLELVDPNADPGDAATEFKFTGFAQDTLSGKVIIRGYAKDDQRIAAIWLKLGTAPAIKILDTITDLPGAQKVSATVGNLDEYLGRLKPAGSHIAPVGSTPDPNSDVGVHDVLNLSGHEVWWAYVWDTSLEPDGVVGDLTVEVIAEDKARETSNGTPSTDPLDGGSASALNGTGDANINYNKITVTRAPYISTLTRFKVSGNMTDTEKAVELRSRNGWYSFRRGVGDTEGLRVDGFNLKGTGNSTFNIDGTNITANITSISTNQQYFLVPNNATSGILTVSAVSGTAVEAVNNRNNNDNSWNKEALAGNEASALWTDDRYVHLFASHNTDTGTNRGLFNKATGQATAKPVYPAMAINPATGTLFASFSSTVLDNGTAFMPVYYSSNGTTVATTIFRHSDPSEWTDISFNYNTGETRPTVIYMGNVYLTDYSIGGLFAYDYNIATKTFNASNTATVAMSGATSGNTYRYYNVERFADTNSGELYNWQNPRLVTSRGTAAANQYMYASYYDKRRGQLHYWSRATIAGNNTSTGGNNSRTWPQIIDGNTSAYGVNGSITNTATGTKNAVAGEYSAIDLTSGGAPVIVYQAKDASGEESVKIAYPNTRTNPTPTGNNWAVTSIPGTTNGGRYISMRIDNTNTTVGGTTRIATNDIHITYMDGENGDLMYVHGTLPNAGTTCVYTFDAPVVIDSVGNVGKWTDLTLDETGRPYISYLDQGGIDSRTGLKMAFYDPNNTAFAVTDPDSSFFASSGWEYVTLPGRYVVNDVRTQIEYDTRASGTAWNAALAYVSGNDYRISYYVK